MPDFSRVLKNFSRCLLGRSWRGWGEMGGHKNSVVRTVDQWNSKETKKALLLYISSQKVKVLDVFLKIRRFFENNFCGPDKIWVSGMEDGGVGSTTARLTKSVKSGPACRSWSDSHTSKN
jgi:hypothetical protein